MQHVLKCGNLSNYSWSITADQKLFQTNEKDRLLRLIRRKVELLRLDIISEKLINSFVEERSESPRMQAAGELVDPITVTVQRA